MTNLYDEEGNLVQGALDPEEVKVLQEEKTKKEIEISEVKERLAKLENKDFNFKKLRDMNKEEKDKLTTQEMELLKRQEKLEEEQKSFLEKTITANKDEALAVIAGDDAELRKKVLFHYDRIKDDAVTKEEVYKKMREASLLAREVIPTPNPVLNAVNYQGSPPNVRKKDSKLTEDQKDLAKKFGISDDDLKKHNVI